MSASEESWSSYLPKWAQILFDIIREAKERLEAEKGLAPPPSKPEAEIKAKPIAPEGEEEESLSPIHIRLLRFLASHGEVGISTLMTGSGVGELLVEDLAKRGLVNARRIGHSLFVRLTPRGLMVLRRARPSAH